MSIVAVHGLTMTGPGTGNVTAPQVSAVGDNTNGLKFTFTASTPGARPDADFDWTFPGGTPATATDTKGPITVTYATAGDKIATLTVAAGAGPPAGGAYPITVTAAAAGPRSIEEAATTEEVATNQGGTKVPGDDEYMDFILAEHSPEEIKMFLSGYQLSSADIDGLVEEETSGENREEVIAAIEAMRSDS